MKKPIKVKRERHLEELEKVDPEFKMMIEELTRQNKYAPPRRISSKKKVPYE